METVLSSSAPEREVWAQELLDRLTPAMSALSVVFLLVVLGEQFARRGSGVATAFTVAGQVLEVVLAMFSVVVLVTLAGSLGAFFLDRRAADPVR